MHIGRLFRTVRHLKPIQLWFQVWRRIQRRFDPHPKCADGELPEFTFLNVTAKPKGWNDESLELLWRYNLHYFEWLNTARRGILDTPQKSMPVGRDAPIAPPVLLTRWIDENPRGSFPGWEPYPTSLRIVNWVKWMANPSASLRLCEKEKIVSSLKVQASWLWGHLEYHLLANHLLANAKSLVFAGKYLVRRDWYEKGMSIFRRELPEQTCGDGVNFERSPMYHAIIFEDMLDLAEYTGEPIFKEYAAKMAEGMKLLTGPDGKIAKFNDATDGIAKEPRELLARAVRLGIMVGRDVSIAPPGSGFLRREAGDWTLLAKCGDIGPSYQPGHAHADTWSFELWRGERKLVGDTGCSTYVPGPIRNYERSTRAHNTVVVDGCDSSEVWASHRVGRRFNPKSHRREFALSVDGLAGRDVLSGKGEHAVEVRFHLPPGVAKNEVSIDCPGTLAWEPCDFAEGWSRRVPGLCAVYSLRVKFPCTIDWSVKGR